MTPSQSPAAAAPPTYAGKTIRQHGRLVNLTSMWHAIGQPANCPPRAWLARPETNRFIQHLRKSPPASPEVMLTDIAALSSIRNIDADFLFVSTCGHRRGLWAHWQIALSYAQDLDPAFHAWCNTVVRDRLDPPAGPPSAIDAPMVRHLERQFALLHDRLDIQDRHVADLLLLLGAAQALVLGNRRPFSERSQAIICQVVANPPFGGRCPCCHWTAVLAADGSPQATANFDHFYHRGLNRPEYGWLICHDCHEDLSRGGYLLRFSKMADFRRFQAALLAHLQAQHRATEHPSR